MTISDLELFDKYINHSSGDGDVLTVRVLLSYPPDYIALLRENEELRKILSSVRYTQVNMELINEVNSSDELHALYQYLKKNNIDITGFKY